MANKKFYWIKLKEDFFDDDTIKYIEEQDNGIIYVNLYLKLCLKSIKSNGKLIRLVGNTLIPYDAKSISEMTRIDVDTVRVAMNLFQRIGLIDVMDTGEIYLSQINEMIGSETDKAALMRKSRAEKKLNGNNVTETLPNCYTDIRYKILDIRDKSIDKDKDNTLAQSDCIAHEPHVIEIALNDNSAFPIYQKQIDEWKELYPNVDVEQQLRSMKGWCNANPTRRKTKSGILRFINSWLAREQDKPCYKKSESSREEEGFAF